MEISFVRVRRTRYVREKNRQKRPKAISRMMVLAVPQGLDHNLVMGTVLTGVRVFKRVQDGDEHGESNGTRYNY